VAVAVSGVKTYLVDSMQFALEYGCRIVRTGCYTVMPSFRDESPDEGHLSQFTHSEAELVGGLDDLISYVEGYVKALVYAILTEAGDKLLLARGDTAHLERMVNRKQAFTRISFEEAAEILKGVDGAVRYEKNWRELTRKGERILLQRISDVLWVDCFDNLAVPFYQAFHDDSARTARNADLYFGMGEIVGAGERHKCALDLRKSMSMHGVPESEYEWYVRMREEMPLKTAGFGMGVDRFLMWVLNHDDIRDLPLISRIDEIKEWPPAVVRP
jgi:aspartyl/asparaginyl-tRNA synthetase